ncbi:hypothetical protein [Halocatena pleomorpha]|uniref:Uncharacterized protein n=1 Tax=Halocatena pleomorpha TaxID=1785090 RepID=A0A3P3R9F4_9EURY|nr:hypothetical protein [Halocatena pleomorpha]RRJ30087.1 hypothetical protein EIK79_10910 [Halocatena pleomorpha]
MPLRAGFLPAKHTSSTVSGILFTQALHGIQFGTGISGQVRNFVVAVRNGRGPMVPSEDGTQGT